MDDQVSIIDEIGNVQNGFIIQESKKHDPCKKVYNPATNKIIMVHKDRIINGDNEGSLVIEKDNSLIALCPKCREVCISNNGKLKCSTHGEIKIHSQISQKSKPKKENCTTTTVTLQEIAQYGELWYKEGKFNSNIKLISCMIIINKRYFTFNLYNMTYGKKNNEPPFELMKQDKDGYIVKDIDKLRKTRIKKGFKKYEFNS